MPEPGVLLDYNRYMYVRGNPLKYNDPGGHYAAHSSIGEEPDPDWSDGACWGLAYTIENMWDDTPYWGPQWGSRDVFMNYVAATGSNDTAFMQDELNLFFNSDDGRGWLDTTPSTRPPALDFGDYTKASVSLIVADFGIIVDDFGNVYGFASAGVGIPRAFYVARGDVYIGDGYRSETTDIDNLDLTQAEKSELMKKVIPGLSSSIDGGMSFLVAGYSESISTPYATTLEGGFAGPSNFNASFTPFSYTRYLFSIPGDR